MQIMMMALVLCGALVSARAEAAMPGQAATPDMGDTWHNLVGLAPHSQMHVSADDGGKTCYLIAVDEQSLTCGRKDGGPKGQRVFPRAGVKSVKLTRYAVSTVVGAGIGAGVGAAIGFGATQNPNGWFNGPVRGVVTVVGAGVGALVCGPGDAFRGPTVYRRISAKK
jgi:hypothetical protein